MISITRTITICIMSGLLFDLTIIAQKKPVKKTLRIVTPWQNEVSNDLPKIKDFAFVIDINIEGQTTVRIQKTEDKEWLMSNELKDFFDKFNVLQNSRKPPPKNLLLDPIVIIRPDPEVRFQAVVNTVHASRVSYNSQVKVDAGEHLFLLIPELPDVKLIPYLKPNPLTLVVKLDSDGNLTLNNEGNGKLDDLSPLSKRLREIFNEREENGVFRENSNIIETTVFLKVPLSTRFSDVTKIAKSIRDSGSTLIGLQVDEVESAVDFRIEMLTPEIKKPE